MAETFSWAALQDVAIGGLKGAANWYNSRVQGQAASIAAEGARKAQNTVAGSKNSLAAVMRNINNANLMRAAQEQYNASAATLARTNEAHTGSRFESSLAQSERDGARASQLAASGVGGSAILATSVALNLQQARLNYAAEKQHGQVTYNIAAQMSGIMPSATAALDRGSLGNVTDQVRRDSSSTSGSAFSLLAAVAVGAMQRKDSMQVMLDSLGAKPQQDVITPVTRGNPQPYALESYPSWESSPVRQGNVQGYNLGPLSSSSTSSVLGGM